MKKKSILVYAHLSNLLLLFNVVADGRIDLPLVQLHVSTFL